VAIRYAKHVEHIDDGKNSAKIKIPALAAGTSSSSAASISDKKSKIQLIEEQLKNLQNTSNDFEINRDATRIPVEPIIKRYQFNKDAPPSSSGRYHHHGSYKKHRKPY